MDHSNGIVASPRNFTGVVIRFKYTGLRVDERSFSTSLNEVEDALTELILLSHYSGFPMVRLAIIELFNTFN